MFDSITVEQLRHDGGLNWSSYPGSLGTFVAEMDFGIAPEIRRAIHEAVDRNLTGYLPNPLSADLAEAAANWHGTRYGWNLSAPQIHPVADVITTLRIAIAHYSRPGSAVIIPTPTYMKFPTVAASIKREQIRIPLVRANQRFEMDLEALDRAFRSGGHLLLLCNPFNPLGRVFSRDELTAISEVVTRHGGRVFADEVHAPLVFDGAKHIPYASISDETASHTVTGTSAAKAWNLAGLKCAQLIVSNEVDEEVWRRIEPDFGHGASILGVVANTAAYSDGHAWLSSVLEYTDRNRHILTERLSTLIPEIGYEPPQGTYIAWLDCRALGLRESPAEFFAEHAGVVLTDGATCGERGRGFVRMVLATPRPILEKMVERMAEAIATRRTT